jgi:hypothetical protein
MAQLNLVSWGIGFGKASFGDLDHEDIGVVLFSGKGVKGGVMGLVNNPNPYLIPLGVHFTFSAIKDHQNVQTRYLQPLGIMILRI